MFEVFEVPDVPTRVPVLPAAIISWSAISVDAALVLELYHRCVIPEGAVIVVLEGTAAINKSLVLGIVVVTEGAVICVPAFTLTNPL